MSAISGITGTSSSQLRVNYLNLLVAQLRNQNPLEPLSNGDMSSQLAMFSQLEQLESMNGSFQKVLLSQQLGQALGMLGGQVSFEPDGADAAVSGIVEGVEISDGQVLLKVGPYRVDPSQVLSVQDVYPAQQLAQAVGMIGKNVSFRPAGSAADVAGTVEAVKVDQGQVLLKVNTYWVKPSEIRSVSQT